MAAPLNRDDPPYLIDTFEMHIAVEPLHGAITNSKGVEVRHGQYLRWVKTDNLARVRRLVTFSLANERTHLFRFLRYQTRDSGAIRNPKLSGTNEADPFDIGRYLDTGTSFVYALTPRAGETYQFEFEILNGFSKDRRHTHFHLPRPAQMKQVVLTIDLTKYDEAGFQLKQYPELYLHHDEPADHDFCGLRGVGSRVGPADRFGMMWRWTVPNLAGGVLDLCWDMIAPPGVEELENPVAIAGQEGIERMGKEATDIVIELRTFLKVAEVFRKKKAEAKALKIKTLSQSVGLSDTVVRTRLDNVSEFFHDYFRKHEHTLIPPDDEILKVEEAEQKKLFGRGQGQFGFRIFPLGWQAEALVRRYLGLITVDDSKTT